MRHAPFSHIAGVGSAPMSSALSSVLPMTLSPRGTISAACQLISSVSPARHGVSIRQTEESSLSALMDARSPFTVASESVTLPG